MSDLVCVFRTNNPTTAELVRSQLENAEIPCFVKSNDASGTLPYLRINDWVEVMIEEDHFELAERILIGNE